MQPSPITHEFIKLAGHCLFAVKAGPKKAPAFVLVHGIGVSHRYFMPLVRELSNKHRVIALDLPGFGASSRPKELLTIADFARIIMQLVKREGLINPILIGHSMGCQIVSEAVRQNPDSVPGIILIGPTINVKTPSPLNHFLRLLRDGLGESLEIKKIVLTDYLSAGMWRYLQTAGPMFADRMEDRLPYCPAKVLVMRGEHDPIATRDWCLMAARLAPHGQYTEIPGGRHVIQFAKAKETALACSRFILSTATTHK